MNHKEESELIQSEINLRAKSHTSEITFDAALPLYN